MPGDARVNVRPAVTGDEVRVLELVRSIDAKACEPWTVDSWAQGFLEALRTSRAVVIEETDCFSQGNVQQRTGGLLACVSTRRLASMVQGWRVEAEIIARQGLGPAQLRACEHEARRLAKRLSGRWLQLRWFPGPAGVDRIVKIQSAHGVSRW